MLLISTYLEAPLLAFEGPLLFEKKSGARRWASSFFPRWVVVARLDHAGGPRWTQWWHNNYRQNKKEKYVNISIDKKDKNLIIDGSSYKGKADKNIIIGTWWNHEIVQKKSQISAVSGRIIEQKVEFLGKEDVKIGDKIYKTLRFNFSSSDPSLSKDKKLNTDIWYEEDTYLWVKAAFDKTGYWEYRIKEVK